MLNLLQRPPSTDLRADISLARAALLLPAHYSRSIWHLAPTGAEGGIGRLWGDDDHSGLTLPINELAVVRLDREWRTATMLTPGVVIPGLDDEALAAGAWAVLTQVNPWIIARLAVSFALRRDVFGSEMDPAVVAAMNFQGPLGNRLAGLARGGEQIWHAPCLLWIAREAAAGMASGAWEAHRPRALPKTLDNDVVVRIFFPTLGTGMPPSPSEIWRGMWVLHQGYRFGDDTRDPDRPVHESLLSLVTSVVYSQPKPGSWLPQIEGWERIYRTDDTDPSVQHLRPKPSQIDLAFRSTAGISVREWLVANWFLASRFFLLAHTHFGELDPPLEWLFAGGLDEPLDPCYAVAVRKLAVSTFTEFGHDVLAENPAYDGVGSTATSDSLASRNHPLLEIVPGHVLPLGLQAVIDHAINRPRLVAGQTLGVGAGARTVNSAIGGSFESYVFELVRKAEGRHHVLTGGEIEDVVPCGQRCDAVIMDHQGDALLVEVGYHGLPRSVMTGDSDAIKDKAALYHRKVKQAEDTREHLGLLACHHGLPRPRSSVILVVTDVGLPMTPAMVDELARQNPRRNPLFVCSVADFEWLVATGEWWSIPAFVAVWQRAGRRETLGEHLRQVAQLGPVPVPKMQMTAAAWFGLLRKQEAA